jgi:hypothetical protein
MLVNMTQFWGKVRDVPYFKWVVVGDVEFAPHCGSEQLEGASGE